MDLSSEFLQLGLALGLGLLVGLQRERIADRVAGVRTFSLITLFGCLSAILAEAFGSWILSAGMIAVAAITVMANVALVQRSEEADPGLTTEIAMLVMYAVGAYLVMGRMAVAVAVGGSVAVLLQWKEPLHRLTKRVGDEDVRAITQFVLISLVILPVLPDRAFGPYGVLNARQIWWMVALIVGIGIAGYLAYRLLGERTGAAVAGFLGGLISSTATSVSYARRAKHSEADLRLASVVILIASATVFYRVLIEIAVVAPEFLQTAGLPVAIMCAAMTALAAVEWAIRKPSAAAMSDHSNPSELRPALLFGGLYAVVLLAVAAAKENLGNEALYAVAALSGLTDMDAITLSTSHLMRAHRIDADTGWRLILTAAMANLLFKVAIVATLSGWQLFRRLSLYFGCALGVGAVLLITW